MIESLAENVTLPIHTQLKPFTQSITFTTYYNVSLCLDLSISSRNTMWHGKPTTFSSLKSFIVQELLTETPLEYVSCPRWLWWHEMTVVSEDSLSLSLCRVHLSLSPSLSLLRSPLPSIQTECVTEFEMQCPIFQGPELMRRFALNSTLDRRPCWTEPENDIPVRYSCPDNPQDICIS